MDAHSPNAHKEERRKGGEEEGEPESENPDYT